MVFLPVVIYSLDETRFLGVKGERERKREKQRKWPRLRPPDTTVIYAICYCKKRKKKRKNKKKKRKKERNERTGEKG